MPLPPASGFHRLLDFAFISRRIFAEAAACGLYFLERRGVNYLLIFQLLPHAASRRFYYEFEL